MIQFTYGIFEFIPALLMYQLLCFVILRSNNFKICNQDFFVNRFLFINIDSPNYFLIFFSIYVKFRMKIKMNIELHTDF